MTQNRNSNQSHERVYFTIFFLSQSEVWTELALVHSLSLSDSPSVRTVFLNFLNEMRLSLVWQINSVSVLDHVAGLCGLFPCLSLWSVSSYFLSRF